MTAPAPLSACPEPLSAAYDVGLLDLDGVVYRGGGAIPHAAETLATARNAGMRLAFVTNNALRPPAEVAARLTAFGVPASADDVVTSAQAAAQVLADRLPAGAKVLVTGGEGLRRAVTAAGLLAVAAESDGPAAVVTGYDPELTYPRLADAAVAIRGGALWVASNTDATVPSERGLLPGAGAIVAFLRVATSVEPLVAGKPALALHLESIRRSRADHPVIVGDRLDTDIEAGTRSGTPSLLVLTGVSGADDLLHAGPAYRPTYVAPDLRGLLAPQAGVERSAEGAAARCGSWSSSVVGGVLSWEGADGVGDGLDALRAACAAAWLAADHDEAVRAIADQRPAGCGDLTA